MRAPTQLLLLCVLAPLLLAAGCGGDDEDSQRPSGGSSATRDGSDGPTRTGENDSRPSGETSAQRKQDAEGEAGRRSGGHGKDSDPAAGSDGVSGETKPRKGEKERRAAAERLAQQRRAAADPRKDGPSPKGPKPPSVNTLDSGLRSCLRKAGRARSNSDVQRRRARCLGTSSRQLVRYTYRGCLALAKRHKSRARRERAARRCRAEYRRALKALR